MTVASAIMTRVCVIENPATFLLRHRCALTPMVTVDDVIIGGGFARGLKAIEAAKLTMRRSHGGITLRIEEARLFK